MMNARAEVRVAPCLCLDRIGFGVNLERSPLCHLMLHLEASPMYHSLLGQSW